MNDHFISQIKSLVKHYCPVAVSAYRELRKFTRRNDPAYLWDRLITQMVRGSHDIFFVQVGAMDGVSFDPLHRYVIQHKWRGLLVEPLSDMFEELKETYRGIDGLIFENVAVADTSGQREMCRIRKEAINLGIVPKWAKGISTFADTEPRNELGPNSSYIEQLRPHIVTETVRCKTLANLLSMHEIKHIDVFVTDVEGYDYDILRQLDFAQYKPSLIRIEWSELSDSDKRMTIELLTNHGYRTKVGPSDLVAWNWPSHLHAIGRKLSRQALRSKESFRAMVDRE